MTSNCNNFEEDDELKSTRITANTIVNVISLQVSEAPVEHSDVVIMHELEPL